MDSDREQVTVTNPELFHVLDQLGLPTVFWGGDESQRNLSNKAQTIKPFPELLSNMETVVKNLSTNAEVVRSLLPSVVPPASGHV